MNRTGIYLLASLMALIVFSCDSTKKADDGSATKDNTHNQNENKPKAMECTYAYVHDSTSVNWTAFKFTDKAGVGGKFDSCSVNLEQNSGSVAEVMKGLTFSIPVNKSNSNNADRDKKILESFWGTLTNTEKITGVISEANGDNNAGTAKVGLVINEVEHAYEAKYVVLEDGHFTLSTTVDMDDFDGSAAITALNAVCKDLHTGTDGVSKLWPTVDVSVSGYFKKDCQETAAEKY